MVFSNEAINKFREKKGIAELQAAVPDVLSKLPTTTTNTNTANNADIELPESINHWFFGIQQKTYPYHLLMNITDCLKDMGFVLLTDHNRNGGLSVAVIKFVVGK